MHMPSAPQRLYTVMNSSELIHGSSELFGHAVRLSVLMELSDGLHIFTSRYSGCTAGVTSLWRIELEAHCMQRGVAIVPTFHMVSGRPLCVSDLLHGQVKRIWHEAMAEAPPQGVPVERSVLSKVNMATREVPCWLLPNFWYALAVL
jgi:hypothetical protein